MWKRDPGVAAMIEHLDRAVPSRLKMTEEDWEMVHPPRNYYHQRHASENTLQTYLA